MAEEERYEKKVEVKEQPLGGTKKVEETEQRVSEEPSTIDQPSRAENVARRSGKVFGKGIKKVACVVKEFMAGVSEELKSGGSPKHGEQCIQQTEYRAEQTQETPQGKVVEKEKAEKKVTKEKE
jgi:hypothetical protein